MVIHEPTEKLCRTLSLHSDATVWCVRVCVCVCVHVCACVCVCVCVCQRARALARVHTYIHKCMKHLIIKRIHP